MKHTIAAAAAACATAQAVLAATLWPAAITNPTWPLPGIATTATLGAAILTAVAAAAWPYATADEGEPW